MAHEADVLDQKRVASATVRGYEFQVLRAARVWLGLSDGETLLCEGDEDLDLVLRDGLRVHEQDKHYRGVLRLRDRAVSDSLHAFARTWVARHTGAASSRFRFVTTADWPRGLDEAAWSRAVRRGFPPLLDKRDPELAAAVATKPRGWDAFCESIEWCLGAESLEKQRTELESALAHRVPHLPARLLAARVVAHLLAATGEDEPQLRKRTRADLESLLRLEANELRAWAQGPGVALVERFDLAGVLEDGLRPVPPGSQLPSDLLVAGARTVSFHHAIRRKEWATLEDALASSAPVLIRLLFGPGGSGKTRFAIEAVQEAAQRGWIAGFVRAMPDDGSWQRLCEGRTPRLVVLDYAESRDRDLRRLLELADTIRRSGGPVLRVLLLARAYSEWWTWLVERGESQFRNLIANVATATFLTPLQLESGDRAALFESARSQLTCHVDSATTVDPPSLDEPAFAQPLYVVAAAYASLLGARLVNGDVVLDWVLQRETLFWTKCLVAQGVEQRPAREWSRADDDYCGPVALACSAFTLLGGARNVDDCEAILSRALVPLPPERCGQIRRALADLYPCDGSSLAISRLEPDLLGELLVSRALAQNPGLVQRLRDMILDADSRTQHCLEVIGRIAMRQPRATAWVRSAIDIDVTRCALPAIAAAKSLGLESAASPVGTCLAEALSAACEHVDSELLLAIERSLPDYSHSLAPVAAWVSERLLVTHGQQSNPIARAHRLLSVAGSSLDIGLADRARDAAQDALCVLDPLVAAGDPTVLEMFARVSNMMGAALAALDDCPAALPHLQRACGVLKRLVEFGWPCLSDLAGTVNSLGSVFGSLGDRSRAMSAAREAVRLRDVLAEIRPRTSHPLLASSLANLANRLREAGQLDEARQEAERAVSNYRAAVWDHPAAFSVDLAMSLNNLAAILVDCHRPSESLVAADEAVRILKSVPNAGLRAHQRDLLAKSLENLAIAYRELDQLEKARAVLLDAEGVYRSLALQHGPRFLAESAHVIGIRASVDERDHEHSAAARGYQDGLRMLVKVAKWRSSHATLAWHLRVGYHRAASAAGLSLDNTLLEEVARAMSPT